MAELKYRPVPHDHEAFLGKAMKRKGFRKEYEDLEEEYSLIHQMLTARSQSGLTQEAVFACPSEGETGGQKATVKPKPEIEYPARVELPPPSAHLSSCQLSKEMYSEYHCQNGAIEPITLHRSLK